MLDVTVLLLDDGLASTAIMPIEVFFSAGALWGVLQGVPAEPRFRVTTATIDGKAVRSPYAGLGLTPEKSISEIDKTDIVVIPTPGLSYEEKHIEQSIVLPWLRKQHAQGAYLAGACMGAAYLAESGLLDGRKGTTHWAFGPMFAKRYPKVDWRTDMMVTEDNRLLCSGGVTGAADVSLYLVEKLCGHEIAVQVAKCLLMPMPRTHQSGYAVLPLSPPHEDEKIRVIETFLAERFCQSHSTNDLAAQANMSVSTFIRRFKAATGRQPGAYLQALRIEHAKAMLEKEGAAIQTVSAAVGYEDGAFFRALFKRTTGMTPAEYRASFANMGVRHEADRAS
jgi:transcriptional regulator GlxA family with amidase domain